MPKYMGVADCYGIESFIPFKEKDAFILKLRADFNRHRHAVFYVVDLTEEQAKKIKELLKRHAYKKALKELKKMKVSFPSRDFRSYSKSWQLIPNPELDPYG